MTKSTKEDYENVLIAYTSYNSKITINWENKKLMETIGSEKGQLGPMSNKYKRNGTTQEKIQSDLLENVKKAIRIFVKDSIARVEKKEKIKNNEWNHFYRKDIPLQTTILVCLVDGTIQELYTENIGSITYKDSRKVPIAWKYKDLPDWI